MEMTQRTVLLLVMAASLLVSAVSRADDDVILMLDNSGSMKQNDPNFLTHQAVTEFVSRLTSQTRVGVIIFDQGVELAVPLTPVNAETRSVILASLEKVTFRGLYTDSPAAMERAIYELKNAGRPGVQKRIIFMTDGIVDTGDTTRDLEKARWLREDLAKVAAQAGIRIYGIAFTDQADFHLIQTLASHTGGEYFRATRPEDLTRVFEGIGSQLTEGLQAPAAAAPVEEDLGTTPEPPDIYAREPESDYTAPSYDAGATGYTPLDLDLPEPADELPGSLDTGSDSAADLAARLAQEDEAPYQANPYQANPYQPEPAPTEPETAPAATPAPPPTAVGGISQTLLIAGAVAGLVSLVIGGVILYRLTRRGDTGKDAAANTPPPAPKAFLNDLTEATGKSAFELSGHPTLVGRSRPKEDDGMEHIVIDETTIGRRHAIIDYKDYSYWLVDLNSRNGTYVNNKRIDGQVPLKHGDRIRFYKTEFEFVMPEMFETGMTVMSHTVFAGDSASVIPAPVPEAEEPEEDEFGPEDTTRPRDGSF